MEDSYPVIIVGAGFAGVAAAKELGRKGVRVLLIDSNNYHQFQPLLYQVATSQIGVSAIARPLRSVFRRYKTVKVLTSKVESVSAADRVVRTSDGRVMRADILVIAVGGRSRTSSIPPPARKSTPFRCIRSPMPRGLGRASPGCWTKLTETPPTGRWMSLWWEAGPLVLKRLEQWPKTSNTL